IQREQSLIGVDQIMEQEFLLHRLIIDTLSHCLGNRTHAANILGISIRTLRNKLKQYSDDGVRVPPPRDGERVSA
ncbi:MAG: helix-turn-helix domain-containing protein, partial [Alphaproteobacteria bacterium]